MSDLPDSTSNNPVLPKWPFWVGDGILVVLGLAVAFSGGEMSPYEAFIVLSSVISGAILLLAPYFIEFVALARVQVSRHEQMSWERVQKMDEVIRALTAIRAELEEAKQVGEDRILGTLGGKFEALKTQIETLEKKVTKLIKVSEPDKGAAAVGDQLLKLESTVVEVQQTLHDVQMMSQRILDDSSGEGPLLDDFEGSDGRLMAKAFTEEKASNGTSAMGRIIQPARPAEEEGEAVAEGESEEEVSGIIPEAIADVLEETEEVIEEEPEVIEEVAAVIEQEEVAVEPDPELELDDVSMGAHDRNPLRSRSKARSKGKDGSQTRIVVEALIGIGNKPYLRGNAAGLSQEKGVSMDYVEIGKWEWVSDEVVEPVNCQVFLNDETPAKEKTTLNPGDNLTVSPMFG